MPIEVRELVIRARVEESQAETAPRAHAPQTESRLSDRELEAIVSQCIDRVLEVMNRQKER